MILRRSIEPAAVPVDVDDAKAHLRVTHTDEDSLITSLCAAAVAHFDGLGVLGRAIITQTWQQSVNAGNSGIKLRMGSFISLVSVDYYDKNNSLQSASLSDFYTHLDGDFVVLKPNSDASWPSTYSRPDAIRITYTAGYGGAAGDVPDNIKHAILLTVGHWYENREAFAEGGFNELPMGVDALICGERITWYG